MSYEQSKIPCVDEYQFLHLVQELTDMRIQFEATYDTRLCRWTIWIDVDK